MKKKILSIGQRIELEGIDHSDFINANSFTDYDDIIIDPSSLHGHHRIDPLLDRRRAELRDFFHILGGNLICFLQPNANLYSWFPDEVINLSYVELDAETNTASRKSFSVTFPRDFGIAPRKGETIGFVNDTHPFALYFHQLKGQIEYHAVIDRSWEDLEAYVIARDRTRKIVGMELPVGEGRAILLPPNKSKDTKKIGGILRNCLEGFERLPTSPPNIEWLSHFVLPREKETREAIRAIDSEMSGLAKRRRGFESQLEDIQKYKILLWGKHKRRLEPVVREALRLTGLSVFDRKEYEEEYDIYGVEDDLYLVGEIEGSKGQVDVKKYRQLLDYYTKERVIRKRRVKALLIGNGFCEQNPEERGEQFTDETIEGCESQGFCYMTTYALYSAVRAILASNNDESLKQQIKEKIIATEGGVVFD